MCKICTIVPSINIELAQRGIKTLLSQTSPPDRLVLVCSFPSLSDVADSFNIDFVLCRRNLHYAGMIGKAYLELVKKGESFDIYHITNDDVAYVDPRCVKKCWRMHIESRHCMGMST